MYFTDRKINRRALSWSDIDFKNFSESQNLINQPYDEVNFPETEKSICQRFLVILKLLRSF